MRPIDIRNDTWESIQGHLADDRLVIWQGFGDYGPCTTRALAEKTLISILTVRPRTTELVSMFLVELVGRNKDGGIYAHVPAYIAKDRFEKEQIKAQQNQLQLF